ncbi:tubulin-folding cofactor C [Punica granatum]|uniref:C-CAP/cofactor C-like domain-containing protein n=2 Tax=Punica granatum TaxID=22663 RepID=A0A218VYH2_PUNGR|nr:tubulin-folding cofactor C [Punica granatum]OWM65637.1 hypothetical protein CDL15_Pgr017134 [Punica granatum]PKI66222.1 hypothetical protein CRG98_013390 [Punica granatum]
MEEEGSSDLSNPNLKKKHLAMLERLSNRQQSLSHRSSSSASAASFESTSSFLSRFAESKRSIESQLAQSRLADPSDLKPQLCEISAAISELEKLVAESSYYLPSYEVRSSLMTVADLKQSLESLIPKKKFSFKSKTAKSSLIEASKPPETEPERRNPDLEASHSLVLSSSQGFRNNVGQVLVKDLRGLEIGEFTITDLESCEVRLLGCSRALFVHRLKDCRVYVGPVVGSVLIEEAENCTFVLASHQIRIHNARGSDFYLRVRSRPIIEDCCRVRFGPYCLRYKGIEEDLREANLLEETGNWSSVDDFKWLKAVQSPNWSVLPEDKRVGMIDISSLGSEGQEDNGEL